MACLKSILVFMGIAVNTIPILPQLNKSVFVQSSRSLSCRQTAGQRPSITDANRKCNIIVYGIQESSLGLSWTVGVKQNLQKATDVLSVANPNTFSSEYISDCHRLGKFSKDSTRSHPLIVKFMRTSDVIQILWTDEIFLLYTVSNLTVALRQEYKRRYY